VQRSGLLCRIDTGIAQALAMGDVTFQFFRGKQRGVEQHAALGQGPALIDFVLDEQSHFGFFDAALPKRRVVAHHESFAKCVAQLRSIPKHRGRHLHLAAQADDIGRSPLGAKRHRDRCAGLAGGKGGAIAAHAAAQHQYVGFS
jgi:hypothetical protein